MFRFCLATAFCFISATTLAQSSFVEVTVDDTLQLVPEEIIYVVHQADYYTTDSVESFMVDTVPVVAQPKGLMDVRKLIADMRLDTLLAPETFAVNSSPYYATNKFIRVRFTSLTKLREFVRRLQKLDGIAGTIGDLSSSKQADAERLLAQRLFEKARAKAAMLAQITGKKLGGLLNAKEEKEQGGWTMYPSTSSIPGWQTTIEGPSSEYIVLSRAMTFQFQWQ